MYINGFRLSGLMLK